MEVTEEATDEVTTLAVAGRLDVAAAREFGERLTTLIQGGRSRLLIEASRLDYIGSMGLRSLLIACNLASQAQGQLVLFGLTPPVRRVVELGGFSDVFGCCVSRDEALEKLSARV
jgi:anti-sigma B factor antagonist